VFLGHIAVALAGKRISPKTSLGTLIFAAQFADLLWPLLLLAGVEEVRIVPGLLPASPFDFVSYPISHSLLADVGWGALLAAVAFAARRDVRSALLLGALVPSHWFLDFIAHRPDLPLYPGGDEVGLSMWSSVAVTILVELALFSLGVALYLRTTRARDRTGQVAFFALVALLVVVFFGALFGPPPPDVGTLAVSALALVLLVPFAAWIDRHRRPSPDAISAREARASS